MPKILTHDEWAQKSKVLADEALEILQSEDSGAEDLERADKLMSESASYFERSKAMTELESQKQAHIALMKNAENEQLENKDLENEEKAKTWKSPGEFFSAIQALRSQNMVDARLHWVNGGTGDHRPISISSRKALAENVGATGGFLVQDEAETRLLSVMNEQSIVAPRAEIIRMNGMSITIPVLDQTDATAGTPSWFGGLVARWEGEASELTETQPNFRQLRLTVRKLTAYTRTSNELVADSAQSLTDFLLGNRGIPAALGWTADRAYLRGDGVGKPQGIIGSGAEITTTRATATEVNYADLTSMLTSFLPSASGVWIAHQTIMNQLLQMTGPAGNVAFLWGGAEKGVPATLLGIPIIFTDRLPVLGATGDIMLADFSYYMIGDRQQITVDTSTEERFQFDQMSWRATMRVDGRPWLSAPITYEDGSTEVSPFVVLGQAA